MMDSWYTNSTVEKPSKLLDALAAQDPDGEHERPVNVIWDTGGVIPYDFSDLPKLEWWIRVTVA